MAPYQPLPYQPPEPAPAPAGDQPVDYPREADESQDFEKVLLRAQEKAAVRAYEKAQAKAREEAEAREASRPTGSDDPNEYQGPRPVLRLRVAKWDVLCTVALVALLLTLATATDWPTRLYGFMSKVCTGDDCGAVPFGIDFYIRPLVWGGVGAAIAAAGIGPFVSLLKGWYMSFWPVLSLAIVMVSSVAGSILTVFSSRYWL